MIPWEAVVTAFALAIGGAVLYVRMTADAATRDIEKRVIALEAQFDAVREQFDDIKHRQIMCYNIILAVAQKLQVPVEFPHGDSGK